MFAKITKGEFVLELPLCFHVDTGTLFTILRGRGK